MDAESAYLVGNAARFPDDIDYRRFRHGVLRDAAYELMTPSRRATLHGLVADCVAELFSERLDPVAGGIADHLALAGRDADECVYRMRAAAYAEANFAHAEAVRHFNCVADNPRLPAPERMAALERIGILTVQIGEPDTAADALRRMQPLVGDDGQLKLLQQGLQARIDLRVGRTTEAAAAFESLAEAYGKQGDKMRELVALGSLSDVKKRLGLFDEAEVLCKRVLEIAIELGDRTQEARTLSHLATTYGFKQQYDLAEEYCQKALKQAEELNDHAMQGGVLNTLAVVQRRLGRPEDAEQTYTRAIELLRETGARAHEGVALGNLGAVLEDLGRFDEAGRLFRQAVALHRRTGNRRFEGVHIGAMAAHAWRAGKETEAHRLIEKAIAILEEVGDAPMAEHLRGIRAGWDDACPSDT